MKIISTGLGALLAACTMSSFAAVTVYDKAKFVPINESSSRYALQGFGRVTAEADSFGSFQAAGTDAHRESFTDIWNIDVTAMLRGAYSFSTVINAVNSLEFSFVDLYSYDGGTRNQLSFVISDDGKTATATGTFFIEKPCPVDVCVWLELRGTQDTGSVTADYGAKFVATAVPEPETYALMLAGLAGIGLMVRRKATRTR